MTDRHSVAVIGVGEAGSIICEDLLSRGSVKVQAWDKAFLQDGSSAAANRHTLSASDCFQAARNAATAATGCSVVLSVVTADQALAAAESVAPGLDRGALYVDLNSVSPGTKAAIDVCVRAAGARFVEAAIMAPIAPLRVASPIALSGQHAPVFAVLADELGFTNLEVVSHEPGRAAATKMCRSVIIKGMEALVGESLLAARHYGVEQAVIASLQNLLPGADWTEQSRYLISRTLQHGTRRAAEMREVSRAVAEAGYEPWMSEACAQRQAWAAQFPAALVETELGAMLDAIARVASAKRLEHV